MSYAATRGSPAPCVLLRIEHHDSHPEEAHVILHRTIVLALLAVTLASTLLYVSGLPSEGDLDAAQPTMPSQAPALKPLIEHPTWEPDRANDPRLAQQRNVVA